MGFRLLRRLLSFFVCEWPNERAAEIVAYAHVIVAIAISAGLVWGAGWSAAWALAVGGGAFVMLMACVCHRYTVWLAALLGSGVSAATMGSLGWLLGHAWQWSYGPTAGTISGAIVGAAAAIPAYVSFIRGLRAQAHETSMQHQERRSLVPMSS